MRRVGNSTQAEMTLLPKRRYLSPTKVVSGGVKVMKHFGCIHRTTVQDGASVVECHSAVAPDKPNGWLCDYHDSKLFPVKRREAAKET